MKIISRKYKTKIDPKGDSYLTRTNNNKTAKTLKKLFYKKSPNGQFYKCRTNNPYTILINQKFGKNKKFSN